VLGIGLATLWTAGSLDAQTADSENIILGRPTDDSVTVHVLAAEETEVFAEYGDSPGVYSGRTPAVEASADPSATAGQLSSSVCYSLTPATRTTLASYQGMSCLRSV
jgi:hypothetical protein